MAAILESVTVPRSSSFRTTLSAPTMASSVCSLSSNCNVSPLREFKGLRIQSRSPKLALSSVSLKNARIARRRGGVVVCEARETTLEVASVTDATWKSLVLDSDLPVLVDFWAPWCGPCRMIHPIIDELAKQYAGKLRCYKLNTDDSPLTATQYGIRSIPTVMIFKKGEKKDTVIGAVPKSTLTASVDKFV